MKDPKLLMHGLYLTINYDNTEKGELPIPKYTPVKGFIRLDWIG